MMPAYQTDPSRIHAKLCSTAELLHEMRKVISRIFSGAEALPLSPKEGCITKILGYLGIVCIQFHRDAN